MGDRLESDGIRMSQNRIRVLSQFLGESRSREPGDSLTVVCENKFKI